MCRPLFGANMQLLSINNSNLTRRDDHESLGVLTAVGDDGALGEIASLAAEHQLHQYSEISKLHRQALIQRKEDCCYFSSPFHHIISQRCFKISMKYQESKGIVQQQPLQQKVS
jgi:hypothetical protein